MDRPKYTFLLPAFKAKYFEEALRSIKAQEFKEFKCIVSDDCSPEDLKSIYDRVVGDDPRFIYHRNAENMGSKSLVSHWNLLVDMCDTEYLIMASDDDVYEPNFLEEIDMLVQKFPEVDVLRGRVDSIDCNGQQLEIDGIYAEYEDNMQYLRSHFSDGNMKCLANHVFRTSALKAVGGFYETPLGWYSDQITAIELSSHGCANTQDIVFHFRYSNQNISGTNGNKRIASKKAIATIKADRWFSNYIKEKNITNLEYRRWGMQIYYWLMDADFKTFLQLLPKVFNQGLWDNGRMIPIIRHQLKGLFLHRQ